MEDKRSLRRNKNMNTFETVGLKNLEKEYSANKSSYTKADWLNAFSKAKEQLEKKLVELTTLRDAETERCNRVLANAHSDETIKGIDLWYLKEIVRIWYILPLKETEKQIAKVRRDLKRSLKK